MTLSSLPHVIQAEHGTRRPLLVVCDGPGPPVMVLACDPGRTRHAAPSSRCVEERAPRDRAVSTQDHHKSRCFRARTITDIGAGPKEKGNEDMWPHIPSTQPRTIAVLALSTPCCRKREVNRQCPLCTR